VSWQVVQLNSTWCETAFWLAICPWQALHSRGVTGGSGACGSWQSMHGIRGLCRNESICGKPVGRDGL
jgi:hypothetical protein